MLFHLKFLTAVWGPFRIMGSHIVLACLGTVLAGAVVWFFLPRLWHVLPRDRGKKLVREGELSAGKPTGAALASASVTVAATGEGTAKKNETASTGAAIAPYVVAVVLLAAAGISLVAVRKSSAR